LLKSSINVCKRFQSASVGFDMTIQINVPMYCYREWMTWYRENKSLIEAAGKICSTIEAPRRQLRTTMDEVIPGVSNNIKPGSRSIRRWQDNVNLVATELGSCAGNEQCHFIIIIASSTHSETQPSNALPLYYICREISSK
jgi:hypothetical protein